MGEIESLFRIDYVRLIMDTFIILVGIVTIWNIIGRVSEIVGKPVGWVKRRSEDHEMIMKTASDLDDFKDKYVSRGLKLEDDVAHLKEFQEELKDTLKLMSDRDDKLAKEINALVIANRETLGDRIDERFRYYFSIGGIPGDEYEGFVSLHDAYKLVGGNHVRDEKYNYAMKNFPILKKGYGNEADE